MENKPPYDNTQFYTEYDESKEKYVTESEKTKMPPRKELSGAYAEQKKKQLLLMVMIAVPVGVCLAVIFYSIGVFSRYGSVGYTILTNVYPFLSCVLSDVMSAAIVKKVFVIGQNSKLIGSHVLYFILFALICGLLVMSAGEPGKVDLGIYYSRNWWRFIFIAAEIALMIKLFSLYNKFEKKFFIPLMSVAFVCTLFMNIRI